MTLDVATGDRRKNAEWRTRHVLSTKQSHISSVLCLSTILQLRFSAQSRDFPLNSNIPVCSTFHFLDSPSKGLQAIYKLQVVFAIPTLKVYLSFSPLSLFLCLLWLWWKRGRVGISKLMNVYEAITSGGRGACTGTFKNACPPFL